MSYILYTCECNKSITIIILNNYAVKIKLKGAAKLDINLFANNFDKGH